MSLYDVLPRFDNFMCTVALVAGFGLNLAWMYKFTAKPADTLEGWGVKGAHEGKYWATVVNLMRFLACSVFLHSCVAVYFLSYVSMFQGIFYLFLVTLGFTCLHAYRAFAEKSGANINEGEVAIAKTNFAIFATVTFLLFLAWFVLYLELYNGLNYTDDAKHGLPKDLSHFVEDKLVRRFLSFKQHVL